MVGMNGRHLSYFLDISPYSTDNSQQTVLTDRHQRAAEARAASAALYYSPLEYMY